MAFVLDNLADYSKTPGASLQPAVPSGITTFALFGRTLAASLNNYINPAAPLTPSAVLSIGTTTGITATATAQLVTPDVPATGSETIFLVMAINPSSWTSFVATPFGSNPVNTTTGTQLGCQHGVAGIQANVGIGPSGTPGSHVISITAGGVAIIDGDTATQAVLMTPQMYMFKIDIPNLLVTVSNLSQPGIASWTKTLVLTSGWVRPVLTQPYTMLCATAGVTSLNASNTYHAYVHYNRATLASEDALIYAQIKKIMATRGITI